MMYYRNKNIYEVILILIKLEERLRLFFFFNYKFILLLLIFWIEFFLSEFFKR